MRMPREIIDMLRRLDPNELYIYLASQGALHKPEPGLNKEETLKVEKRFLLAGAHRARLSARGSFSIREIEASRKWLARNGFDVGDSR